MVTNNSSLLGDGDHPENILIINANPRSGSTWLFDALRCHPAIEMLIRGDIYRELNLSGRRYPRDLVPGKREYNEVEVRADLDKWAKVPLFSIPDGEYDIPEEIKQKKYAIEKIHPHFYGFNIGSFVSNMKKINDTGRNLQMIYLVRDPKASLVSFFNYQKRNPDWNSGKNPPDVIKHMNLIYQNLMETARQWAGSIIDYRMLREDFDNTLDLLFEFLWPGSAGGDLDRKQIIDRIKAETAWERRKSKRPFLGNQIGSMSGEKSEYDPLFDQYSKEISRCYAYYETLLSLE